MKIRKSPQRKCLGCQQVKDKKDLIRIVRGPEGEVSLDLTGRKAGRGAYLCKDVACLLKAQKSKALENSLQTPIDAAVYEELKSGLKNE